MEGYTVKEIVERIRENRISAYEVTCLPSNILLSDKVLLALMTSHTVPLEFALQDPKVQAKLESNKNVHDVVMKSNTELEALWDMMQQYDSEQYSINYNLILEALTGEDADFLHPSNRPNIWVLYGLYPGLKQIQRIFGDKIPAVGDIKAVSDEVLETKTVGGITVRQKLLNAIDKIEKLNEEYTNLDYSFLKKESDEESESDYNPFIRTRKKRY